MKVVRNTTLIAIILGLALVAGYIPSFQIKATSPAQVYLSAFPQVYPGDRFTTRINVSNVSDLQAWQIQVTFNHAVIQVDDEEGGNAGVTPGLIGTSAVVVDAWSYPKTDTSGGTIRIMGRIEQDNTISGSGYLAEIHFFVTGSIGQTSTLTPTELKKFRNGLFNGAGEKISTTTPWSGCSVQIVQPVPLNISTQTLPSGAAGSIYTAHLQASGGYPPYSWSASDLPPVLAMSKSGLLSGTLMQNDNYVITVTVSDSHDPPDTSSGHFLLKSCQRGDANEDGILSKKDVNKIIRIYLKVDSPTPAADANGDGKIDLKDVVIVQRMMAMMSPNGNN